MGYNNHGYDRDVKMCCVVMRGQIDRCLIVKLYYSTAEDYIIYGTPTKVMEITMDITIRSRGSPEENQHKHLQTILQQVGNINKISNQRRDVYPVLRYPAIIIIIANMF